SHHPELPRRDGAHLDRRHRAQRRRSGGRPVTPAPLLSADEALLLERLTLRGGGFAVSPSPSGTRRARTRGAGIEFHEFRPYQAGDDPRGIDWTVEARLRQLVVRVPQAE